MSVCEKSVFLKNRLKMQIIERKNIASAGSLCQRETIRTGN